MATPYKKRAKGSWNVGKGCKGDSEERAYAQREIEAELAAHETGLTPHKGKRKKNKRASLEHTISWYEQTIQSREREGVSDSFTHYLRDGLKRALAQLKKMDDK